MGISINTIYGWLKGKPPKKKHLKEKAIAYLDKAEANISYCAEETMHLLNNDTEAVKRLGKLLRSNEKISAALKRRHKNKRC